MDSESVRIAALFYGLTQSWVLMDSTGYHIYSGDGGGLLSLQSRERGQSWFSLAD